MPYADESHSYHFATPLEHLVGSKTSSSQVNTCTRGRTTCLFLLFLEGAAVQSLLWNNTSAAAIHIRPHCLMNAMVGKWLL